MNQEQAIAKVTSLVIDGGYKKATYYHCYDHVIKATRLFKNRSERLVQVVLTLGQPNYSERKFIKTAQKAGESFPIKKIQVKSWKR